MARSKEYIEEMNEDMEFRDDSDDDTIIFSNDPKVIEQLFEGPSIIRLCESSINTNFNLELISASKNEFDYRITSPMSGHNVSESMKLTSDSLITIDKPSTFTPINLTDQILSDTLTSPATHNLPKAASRNSLEDIPADLSSTKAATVNSTEVTPVAVNSPEAHFTSPKTTPEASLSSPTTTPEPSLSSPTATPEAPCSLTTTPKASISSPTITPESTLISPTTTPKTSLSSPTTPEASLSSPTTTPEASLSSPTTTPEASLSSPTTTPEASLSSPTTTPEPSRSAPTTTPEPSLSSPSTTPEPSLSSPTTTPEPSISSPTTIEGISPVTKNCASYAISSSPGFTIATQTAPSITNTSSDELSTRLNPSYMPINTETSLSVVSTTPEASAVEAMSASSFDSHNRTTATISSSMPVSTFLSSSKSPVSTDVSVISRGNTSSVVSQDMSTHKQSKNYSSKVKSNKFIFQRTPEKFIKDTHKQSKNYSSKVKSNKFLFQRTPEKFIKQLVGNPNAKLLRKFERNKLKCLTEKVNNVQSKKVSCAYVKSIKQKNVTDSKEKKTKFKIKNFIYKNKQDLSVKQNTTILPLNNKKLINKSKSKHLNTRKSTEEISKVNTTDRKNVSCHVSKDVRTSAAFETKKSINNGYEHKKINRLKTKSTLENNSGNLTVSPFVEYGFNNSQIDRQMVSLNDSVIPEMEVKDTDDSSFSKIQEQNSTKKKSNNPLDKRSLNFTEINETSMLKDVLLIDKYNIKSKQLTIPFLDFNNCHTNRPKNKKLFSKCNEKRRNSFSNVSSEKTLKNVVQIKNYKYERFADLETCEKRSYKHESIDSSANYDMSRDQSPKPAKLKVKYFVKKSEKSANVNEVLKENGIHETVPIDSLIKPVNFCNLNTHRNVDMMLTSRKKLPQVECIEKGNSTKFNFLTLGKNDANKRKNIYLNDGENLEVCHPENTITDKLSKNNHFEKNCESIVMRDQSGDRNKLNNKVNCKIDTCDLKKDLKTKNINPVDEIEASIIKLSENECNEITKTRNNSEDIQKTSKLWADDIPSCRNKNVLVKKNKRSELNETRKCNLNHKGNKTNPNIQVEDDVINGAHISDNLNDKVSVNSNPKKASQKFTEFNISKKWYDSHEVMKPSKSLLREGKKGRTTLVPSKLVSSKNEDSKVNFLNKVSVAKSTYKTDTVASEDSLKIKLKRSKLFNQKCDKEPTYNIVPQVQSDKIIVYQDKKPMRSELQDRANNESVKVGSDYNQSNSTHLNSFQQNLEAFQNLVNNIEPPDRNSLVRDDCDSNTQATLERNLNASDSVVESQINSLHSSPGHHEAGYMDKNILKGNNFYFKNIYELKEFLMEFTGKILCIYEYHFTVDDIYYKFLTFCKDAAIYGINYQHMTNPPLYVWDHNIRRALLCILKIDNSHLEDPIQRDLNLKSYISYI